MEAKTKTSKERFFSVELTSKADLRNVNMTNGLLDNVLVEGTIGELVQAGFTEGVVLEVVGRKGIVRVDLEENEVTGAGNRRPASNALTLEKIGHAEQPMRRP